MTASGHANCERIRKHDCTTVAPRQKQNTTRLTNRASNITNSRLEITKQKSTRAVHFLKVICLCKKRTNTRLAILTNPRRRAKRLFVLSNEHQTSVHRKNDCPQIHSSSPFGYGVAILTKENAAADTQTVSHPQSPKAGRCWTESPQKAGRTRQCYQQRKDQRHTEKCTQHSEKKLPKKSSHVTAALLHHFELSCIGHMLSAALYSAPCLPQHLLDVLFGELVGLCEGLHSLD